MRQHKLTANSGSRSKIYSNPNRDYANKIGCFKSPNGKYITRIRKTTGIINTISQHDKIKDARSEFQKFYKSQLHPPENMKISYTDTCGSKYTGFYNLKEDFFLTENGDFTHLRFVKTWKIIFPLVEKKQK